MRLSIFIVLLSINTTSIGQKKPSLDLNFGILNSIGNNISKIYNSKTNPLTIEYSSRRKFEHPYLNLLINISYPINKNISLGLQSGIYIHFLEQYFSDTERTTASLPIMATFKCNFKNLKKNKVGINLAGGIDFFNVYENLEGIKNGAVLNASIFYLIDKVGIIKFGLEKEIDNASISFIASNQYYHDETFKYSLNRLSIFLSYGFIFKK